MESNSEKSRIAWTNVKTPAGFHWSITIRENDSKSLTEAIDRFESYCGVNSWIAEEIRSSGSKGGFFPKKPVEYAEGTCPLCNGKLLKKTSKAGKNYIACENGKYNFNTKETEGCKFIKWD